MKESEERSSNIDEQKARIRQRYKGIDPEELEVIPALPPEDIFKTEKKLRVAVYARVSTDDPRQTSSYELQKNHYQDVVNKNPNWMLVEIYADEGISGTSLQHRDAFKKMIEDCEAGKIDLIITKSVSRFARNVVDCIRYVRELSSLRPPVGVFFETEHLNTLDPKSEMILSFRSTLAQEESHTKSEIMDSLTELGCKTKKNNDVWSSSTILQILQNERHCGDVLARKTWTPNYLDHKSRKNNQDRNQYRKVGHHEAIISRDDFIAVQKLITNAKYGNKEILPELHVIQEGSLSGFISINPRWSGFKARDYFEASQSVLKPENMNEPDTIIASAGSFDLRDYEVARGQFFSSVGRISVSFSYKQISFNKDAIRKFPNIKFVELLIHPSSKLLAIRPCSSETKNKVQWSRLKDGQLIPKPISGAAFLPTLYEIFKWDKKCKYRILGVAHQKGNENVLIFIMDDTEIRIPTSTNDVSAPNNNMPDTISDSKSVLAYPADWMNSFGNNYYTQSQAPELTEFTADKNWQTASESKPYKEPELQTTPKETIIQNIKNIITEIKGDTQ